MAMESNFRPEDKGRMSDDEAHEAANKLKTSVQGTGEGEFFNRTRSDYETRTTAEDYQKAQQALDEIEAAPQNLEAQRNIISKLGHGAWAVVASVLGEIPTFNGQTPFYQPEMRETFKYFYDGEKIRKAKEAVRDLQIDADAVARLENKSRAS